MPRQRHLWTVSEGGKKQMLLFSWLIGQWEVSSAKLKNSVIEIAITGCDGSVVKDIRKAAGGLLVVTLNVNRV